MSGTKAQPGDPAWAGSTPLGEVMRIAGPTVAAMTSYTIMQFCDKWLVSNIGPEPVYVGAQGNGGLAAWVPISIAQGTISIVNTYVSQNMGAGKGERAGAYAWNGAWMALFYWAVVLVPFLFVLPAVLRAAGIDPEQARLGAEYGQVLLWGAGITMVTRAFGQFFFGLHRAGIIMVAGIVANVFNLYISAVLVFGNAPPPEALGWFGRAAFAAADALGIEPMGVKGSAVGTVLATALELAIPLVVFLSPSFAAKYGTRSSWRLSWPHIRDILRLGWPGGLMFGNEMVCWGFFMVYLVSGFGREHATAGWIAHQYMSLSFMPAVGLSVACTALVGKYQGMKRSDLASHRAWLCIKAAMVYMGLCAVAFVVFRRELVELFVPEGSDGDTTARLVTLGSAFMIATAAFQVFDAGAMTISGALRGAGDTVVPGVSQVVGAWVIIVGGGLGMVHFAPRLESLGPWIAAAVYIAALCLFLLWRFLGGRWKSIEVVKTG